MKQLLAECAERGFLYRQCAAASSDAVTYKFVHDNIQEAAMLLIGHQDLAHFYIGKVLSENLPPDIQEENLFVIARHYAEPARSQGPVLGPE